MGTAWDFVSGSASYSGSNFDFYSVAVHELAHVLGFGTTPSYDNYVDSGTFTGPRATAVNSNTAVALEPFDNYHLDEGILDPTLTAGTRETWGTLETAVMQDIWNIQAVPEPSTITILLPLLYSALFFRNRRKMVAS